MLNKIKESKNGVVIYNLFFILLFWIVFIFITCTNWYKIADILNSISGSFFTVLAYLLVVPLFFSIILFLILAGRNKKEKKKWVLKGVIIPFVIWSIIFIIFELLFYFFGFSG